MVETGTEVVSAFEGKRVLITGGLGFIGSNLAKTLVEDNAIVTVIDSLVPEYGGNLFNVRGFEDRLTINISDVRDPHSLAHLIQGQDYLFNLAGQTSHLDSMVDPFTDLDINCRAQISILEAVRRANPTVKMVFASTRQLYGKPEVLPVSEQHPTRPVDVNGINKLAAEWYHRLYHDVYGIPATILRLTNTYGPRMRVKDARQTFLGSWIRLVVEGQPFEVWEGAQLRDFTYVDDAIDALLRSALSAGGDPNVFNVGGLEVISLIDLASLLVKAAGTGEFVVKQFPEERKQIDIGDYYSDDALIRETLGWQPRVALADGLGRTVAYYREHLEEYR
jgi:UDP-glucose 4-epimerase